jgi:hypothetical protein
MKLSGELRRAVYNLMDAMEEEAMRKREKSDELLQAVFGHQPEATDSGENAPEINEDRR